MRERAVLDSILLACSRGEATALWRRNVGAAQMADGSIVRFGTPGMADLWGVARGRHVEVEVKTGALRLTEPQRLWRNLCCKVGALHILAICSARLTVGQQREREEQLERGGLHVAHGDPGELAMLVFRAIGGTE